MIDRTEIFDNIFRNTRQNAMIIMNKDGIIQEVNDAFTTSYWL